MVYRRQKFTIAARAVLMLVLHVSGFEMAFMLPSHLVAARPRHDSASATVVADAVYRHIIDDGPVVDVDVGDGHVIYAAIVEKIAGMPVAAAVAHAKVAKAVINAAVEADVRAPIARVPGVKAAAKSVTLVKNVNAVVPSPPGRGPQQADPRRCDPDARHPIITTCGPTPVSGSPDVAIPGTSGLRVHRQRRRRN